MCARAVIAGGSVAPGKLAGRAYAAVCTPWRILLPRRARDAAAVGMSVAGLVVPIGTRAAGGWRDCCVEELAGRTGQRCSIAGGQIQNLLCSAVRDATVRCGESWAGHAAVGSQTNQCVLPVCADAGRQSRPRRVDKSRGGSAGAVEHVQIVVAGFRIEAVKADVYGFRCAWARQ